MRKLTLLGPKFTQTGSKGNTHIFTDDEPNEKANKITLSLLDVTSDKSALVARIKKRKRRGIGSNDAFVLRYQMEHANIGDLFTL